MNDWLAIPVGNATRKSILRVLAIAANADDLSTFIGQDTIAERAECDVRTVRRHLAALEADGRIMRKHRYNSRGKRTSDLITLIVALPDNLPRSHESLQDNLTVSTGQNVRGIFQVINLEEDAARKADAFDRLWISWPFGCAGSREAARTAWAALSSHEQAEAIASVARYLDAQKAHHRDRTENLSRYLLDKPWRALATSPTRWTKPVERSDPAAGPRQKFAAGSLEFARWQDHYRATGQAPKAEEADARGYVREALKWPPPAPPNPADDDVVIASERGAR